MSISKIDCDQYKSICTEHKVRGYPTLLWIVDGKQIAKYQGGRTHEELKAFVAEKIAEDKAAGDTLRSGDIVPFLTDASFEKTIKSGVTFVKFLAPWCAHCKRLAPIWDALGTKTHGIDKLRIAKVDCGQFETLCNEHKVDGYPTLVLYKDGKLVTEYEGERTLDEMYNFVSGHAPSAKKDEL